MNSQACQSRAACRILGVASYVISHAYDVVVAPVTFLTSRGAEAVKQSWRLSHYWCRDRRVYCRIAVRHSISKYRPSVPRSMGGDSRQHVQTWYCRCRIFSRPTFTCSRRRLSIVFSDLDEYVAVPDLSRHVGKDGVFFPIPKSSVELL